MLALKLLLVPILIAVLTLIGRRFGPSFAGWLAGLPVVAAPILLLLALSEGVPFAAAAAAGALTAVPANVFFCLGFSWAATRFAWWISLAAGFAGYAFVASLLTALALPNLVVFALTLALLWVVANAFPRNVAILPAATPSRAELPFRMIASAALVLAVTFFSSHLGPRVSGLFSTFPLMASVLAAFSHALSGPGSAIGLLRGMASGFYSLATFCFTLSLFLAPWGMARGFVAALACAMLAQLGSLWLRSHQRVQPLTPSASRKGRG